jgi:hypothetical protein
MKKTTLLLTMLFVTLLLQAQVSKTAVCTAGALSNLLTTNEKNTVTNLTITGTIDARDFKTMRDSMGVLANIDLSGTVVLAYNGALGTSGSSVYSENAIPDWAFSRYEQGKPSLISIINPSSITKIGQYAYYNCTNLTSIDITNTVTYISNFAFGKCRKISSLFIPSSVTTIQYYPFYDCGGDVTVDANNPNYSSANGLLFDKTKSTLMHCPALKTGIYTIPSSVLTVADNAFNNCTELDSIIIPSSVKTIMTYAFKLCTGLSGIIIPTSVTAINFGAFEECTGITSITIPSSITSIPASGFYHCCRLKTLNFASSVTSIGEYTFAFCDSLLTLNLPSNLKTIGRYSFTGCSGLTSISIPSTVTSIGEDAFVDCSGLITVNPSNTAYSSLDGVLFNKAGTSLIHFPISIEGNYVIPSTVISMVSSAFTNCRKLTSITIPATVTSMGFWNFIGCSGDILVNPANPNFISIDGVLFNKGVTKLWHCPTSKKGSYTAPSTNKEIGDQAFYKCDSLKSIILPPSVTSFGFAAFMDCSELSSFTFPVSLNFVNGNAFDGCIGLKSINLTNTTPVGLSDPSIFNNVDRNTCTLYVPVGSSVTYQNADVWKDFVHIIEGEGFWLSKYSSNLANSLNSYDSIEIHSNTSWNINLNQTWLSVNHDTGTNDDTLVITAEDNLSAYPRSAIITVSSSDVVSQTISVTQEGTLPSELTVTDTVVSNTESACFNAYDTITVAGGGTIVEFLSGSSVNLIAGQAIRLLPGFYAYSGSYVDAHITSDSTFCDGASGSIAVIPEEKSAKEELLPQEPVVVSEVKSVKVFPNPNNGQFTIELTNIEGGARVTIYSILGATVFQSTANDITSHKINLPEIRKGIYLVKVMDGKEQLTRKMVVN